MKLALFFSLSSVSLAVVGCGSSSKSSEQPPAAAPPQATSGGSEVVPKPSTPQQPNTSPVAIKTEIELLADLSAAFSLRSNELSELVVTSKTSDVKTIDRLMSFSENLKLGSVAAEKASLAAPGPAREEAKVTFCDKNLQLGKIWFSLSALVNVFPDSTKAASEATFKKIGDNLTADHEPLCGKKQ